MRQLSIQLSFSLPTDICTVISDCLSPGETICSAVRALPDCQLILRHVFNDSGTFCINVSMSNDVSLAVTSARVNVIIGESKYIWLVAYVKAEIQNFFSYSIKKKNVHVTKVVFLKSVHGGDSQPYFYSTSAPSIYVQGILGVLHVGKAGKVMKNLLRWTEAVHCYYFIFLGGNFQIPGSSS